MFRITSRTAGEELLIKLEGCLEGPWVRELAAYWRGAVATSHGGPLRVDLTDVCRVDEAGRELMTDMLRAGARFIARGCEMPELVRELSETVRN